MDKENKKVDKPKKSFTSKLFSFLKTTNPILTDADLDKFVSRRISERKFNSGVVKFSRFYALNKTWVKYLLAFVLGLVMSIATVLLVEVTGLYTGGFGACLQGVARLVYTSMMKHSNDEAAQLVANYVFNGLFWGLYLLLNIPLTIFAFKKIGKSFTGLSLTYLITLQVLGFAWGTIPGIHSVQIFGDTSTVNAYLDDYGVKSIIFSPNWFPNNDIFQSDPNWPWSPGAWQAGGPNADHDIQTDVVVENITKAFLLLVYAIIFSVISAFCYTLMFILGGSTAGSDYLTIYWSQEKNKNVGSIFIIITSISMLLGIMMGTYGSGALIDSQHYSGWQYLFSANLFTSFVWVLLNGILIDKWFPWHKLIRVEVYSTNVDDINAKLKNIKYPHPATLLSAQGGYSGQQTKMLLTICMVVELPQLISAIRSIDKDCLVSSSFIADIDGRMTIQRQAL